MSVTTTQNATYNATLRVLADYELHHSGTADPQPEPNAHPNPLDDPRPGAGTEETRIPDSWPTDHRRIPAYRPTNRHLVQSERRVFQNQVERAFVLVMFTGVWEQSMQSRIWRATGGRINKDFFKFAIGGEY